MNWIVCNAVQVSEGELSADKLSLSPQDVDSDAASGADDITTMPADESIPADSSLDREVENCNADPDVSAENASEDAADEIENKEQECLIILDDDDDVNSSGPAADEDVTECHINRNEDHVEDDNPSDYPSQDVADAEAVVSDDNGSGDECSTEEM